MILETSQSFLSLSLRIASAGVIINALETLVRQREYASDGLFSWDVLKTSYRVTLRAPGERFFDWLCSPGCFLALMAGQLLAGLYLLWFGAGPLAPMAVAWNLGVFLLFNFRNQSGLDGADQMQLLIHGGSLAFLLAPGSLGQEAAMAFIAFQSVLSYLTAGLAKARSKVWRSGTAVRGIWSTESYGLACTTRWLANSASLSFVLSWMTIIFEIGMPFLLLCGRPGAWAFVVIGLMFHLANAVVMGLNGFLWAFLASYPAVLYVAGRYFQY